jgi:hypothetical protein
MTDRDPKVVNRIFWAIVIASLVCAAMLFMGVRAKAQALCGPYQAMVFSLTKAGEQQVSVGIVSGGESIMVVFASPKTRSWTLMLTREGGLACVVAAGSDYDARAALFDPT